MRCLFTIAMAWSTATQACTPEQIEAATSIVLQANPVLQAERQELAEQSRQRVWSARVSMDYPLYTSSPTEAGPSVGFQVVIPLFDRVHDLKLAKARAAFNQRQDGVLADFMSQMERLCSKIDKVRGQGTMRRFYHDRLEYRQEQVKEGLEEAGTLWKETEKVQQVEHDYRREQGELVAMQLAIAHRYGGDEWKRLQGLLAAASR